MTSSHESTRVSAALEVVDLEFMRSIAGSEADHFDDDFFARCDTFGF
jgi:hypothetical protein